ncbi:hypothetical protein ACHAXS_011399 [Conticribra weissflogii]
MKGTASSATSSTMTMAMRLGMTGSRILAARAVGGRSTEDVTTRTARRAASSSSAAHAEKTTASSERIGEADAIFCGRQRQQRWQSHLFGA